MRCARMTELFPTVETLVERAFGLLFCLAKFSQKSIPKKKEIKLLETLVHIKKQCKRLGGFAVVHIRAIWHTFHPNLKMSTWKKFLIFPEMELFSSYIFSKESISYISKNGTLHFSSEEIKIKKHHPGKIYYTSRKEEPEKKFWYFRRKFIFSQNNSVFNFLH